MKRKTLLLLVSLFSSLCMAYQAYIIIPGFLDAWNALSQLPGGVLPSVREQIQLQFFKALLGLILQVCFYGTVAFWSYYEATGKLVGSPLKTTEVTVDKPKNIAKIIQTLMTFVILVIFLFGMYSLINGKFNTVIDFVIVIALMIVPLIIMIIIERKKCARAE